jgi:hypothetical protein
MAASRFSDSDDALSDFDLGQVGFDISKRSADQTIQIGKTDCVWINEHKSTDADVRQLLDHMRSSATETHDPHAEMPQDLFTVASQEALSI